MQYWPTHVLMVSPSRVELHRLTVNDGSVQCSLASIFGLEGGNMAEEERVGRVAERMFPAPADLGIAQPDRAVCNVRFGTTSYQEGGRGDGDAWYEGGGAVGEKAVQPIVIYPPTRGVATQGDPFEPVKIGVLVDM